jgi:hypothetical protein
VGKVWNNCAPHNGVAKLSPEIITEFAGILSTARGGLARKKEGPRALAAQRAKFREETPVTRQDEEAPRPARDHLAK